MLINFHLFTKPVLRGAAECRQQIGKTVLWSLHVAYIQEIAPDQDFPRGGFRTAGCQMAEQGSSMVITWDFFEFGCVSFYLSISFKRIGEVIQASRSSRH